MKIKNILSIAVLLLLGLTTSCMKGPDGNTTTPASEVGYLSLELASDNVVVEAKSDPKIYAVTIAQTDGTVVESYPDHTAMPSKIKLKTGTYKLSASCGTNVNAGFDTPYYYGEKQITITSNSTLVETLTCSLANIKVTVTFSDVIKSNFSTYDVVINNGETGIITFTKNDEGKNGYLKVPASENKTIVWNLNLVNNQGVIYTANKTITGVKARDFYKFHFDINQDATDDEGAFGIEISVDDKLDEKDHSYDINLKKKSAPVITGRDFDIASAIMVNETVRGANAYVNVVSAATLQDLSISHNSDYIASLGIPKNISFVTASASELATVTAQGITFQNDIIDQGSVWVDFSTLANKLPLGEYKITLIAYDAQRQETRQTITINVIPDQDHMALSSDPWGEFATVVGQWNTVTCPEGLTFQYRADGSETWTNVPTSSLTYDNTNKKITAKIHSLNPSTKYYFRTYSTSFTGTTEMSFTTETTPGIPNMNFDSWTQNSNKWYPNADASNSYWATGNEGTALAGKGSITQPSDDAVSGKAACMTSVGGVMVAKHAAGNLYIGTYSTNLSNPRASAVFGRPYTGRPVALKGWFKYHPELISIDKDNLHADQVGKLDKCHIYIILEDWGGSTTRPDNPTQIAYGEMKTDEEVTSYRQFTIPLTYYNTKTKPTHITIGATTSHLGGDFCGGVGCTLYVDEFALLFDDEQ
ncbi:MAG: DUF4493 domain-containing protein [Flavobacteriales bacterium]|nr:DUF4493 domain-containing protein [Flavobacteriales bacterium]